jgi:pimeloyl-ACP methyl ester carboxylesterase
LRGLRFLLTRGGLAPEWADRDNPYRLDVLEGAGHWLPEHHPQELAQLVLDHLEDRAPAF